VVGEKKRKKKEKKKKKKKEEEAERTEPCGVDSLEESCASTARQRSISILARRDSLVSKYVTCAHGSLARRTVDRGSLSAMFSLRKEKYSAETRQVSRSSLS
jgi:hypothetical protein